VRAESNDSLHIRGERVYVRQLADLNGTPVERKPHAFLKAAKVLRDTRLAARRGRYGR